MNEFILESKVYNFSTRSSCGNILNQDSNYKSLIQYNIPNMVTNDDTIEFIQVSVPYAIIPVSYYTINHTNCKLDVTFDGVKQSFTFQYGNYNVSLFIIEFDLHLSAHGFSLIFDTTDSIFTMKNTSKAFTIHASSTMDYIMGFSDDLTATLSSGVYSIEMPRCCNFLPLPVVCIRCNEFSNTSNVGVGGSDILVTIPNNAKVNGQIYYQNTSGSKMLFRGYNLSNFIISLTDEDGALLNFNGVASYFSIQVDLYRKQLPKLPNFDQIMKSLAKRTSPP